MTTESQRLNKIDLYNHLDSLIIADRLVELHTHLMGMGPADFWVTRVMEVYLIRRAIVDEEYKEDRDVKYYVKDICLASNIIAPSGLNGTMTQEYLMAALEAQMFDGLQSTMQSIFQVDDAGNYYITNHSLVYLLQLDDLKPENEKSLRAMVRNWFEFLDTAGNKPHQVDILETYRGHFTPAFYPRRFEMKDVIVKKYPEVLSILLNYILHNYSTAGVNYVEFSVSIKDLLNPIYRHKMTENVFNGSYLTSAVKRALEPLATATDDEHAAGPAVPNSSKKRKLSEQGNFAQQVGHSIVIPHMPKQREVDRTLAPSWRKYIKEYHAKADNQRWCFLAAINRNKDIRYPVWSTANQLLFRPLKFSEVSPPGSLFDKQPTELNPFVTLINLANNDNGLKNLYTTSSSTPSSSTPSSSTPSIDELLSNLAKKYLTTNSGLEQIFPHEFSTTSASSASSSSSSSTSSVALAPSRPIQTLLDQFTVFVDHSKEKNKPPPLESCVVGFDWVGDEQGYPFCLFAHTAFLDVVKELRKINPRFGLRIHAGEGLIRHATPYQENSSIGRALKLHMYILMHTLIHIINYLCDEKISSTSNKKIKRSNNNYCGIRIGHGVAFLYGVDIKDTKQIPAESKKFYKDLAKFREILKVFDIACELNPVSNHMLLPSTFDHQNNITNDRSLSAFLEADLPVTLCTDDDGIWAIQKCSQHLHHVSVAYEYCNAIHRGEITTEQQLDEMVERARNAAFALST